MKAIMVHPAKNKQVTIEPNAVENNLASQSSWERGVHARKNVERRGTDEQVSEIIRRAGPKAEVTMCLPRFGLQVPRLAGFEGARHEVAQIATKLDVEAPVVRRIPWISSPNANYFKIPPFTKSTIGIVPSFFDYFDHTEQQFILAHEFGHLCLAQTPICGPFQGLAGGADRLGAHLDVLRQRYEYAADWFAVQLVGQENAVYTLKNSVFSYQTASEYNTHPSQQERLRNIELSNATYLHLPDVSTAALVITGGPRGWMLASGNDPADCPIPTQSFLNTALVLNINLFFYQRRRFRQLQR